MKIYISPEVLTWKTYAWGDTNEHEQMSRLARLVEGRYSSIGGQIRIANKSLTTTTRNVMLNGRLVSGRIADAVTWGADVFIGLHSNARGNTEKPAKGAVIFHDEGDADGLRYAQIMYSKLEAIMPHESPHGDVRPHKTFYEVVEPKVHGMTAVYIETEFHDQEDSARWIVEYMERIADAIVDGLTEISGLLGYPFDSPYRAEMPIQGYKRPRWTGGIAAIKRQGETIHSVRRYDVGDNSFVQCAETEAWYLVKANGRWQVSDARAKTYTVKAEDTLWSIAHKHLGSGFRYTEILALNQIKDPALIRVGQVLTLPKA